MQLLPQPPRPRRLVAPAALCAFAFLAMIGGAAARNVYRWVDAQGMVHYTDQPPSGTAASRVPISTVRIEGEVAKIASLRIDSSGDHYEAVATNTTAGPVEVELQAVNASNFASDPSLPLRAVLKPYASTKIAVLSLADPTRNGGFQLKLGAIPGDPHAQPQDVAYRLPVDVRGWSIAQGWHGKFTHNDAQSEYAIDISVDEGTPVLAAREGTVTMVESDFDKAGLNRDKYVDRANEIRILHDDGTMAVYAHLKLDGALVRPGQHVVAGQRIGYSGNTGFTTGPHLHFCVQANRGFDLESIPFRMQGPSGPVAIPEGR
jgi:murein DD-endopeptidase MepM/ murein hydrolase activator NlpD